MIKQTLAGAVGATTYPGRGIIAGRCACGARAVLAYFIMGRSVNSRNRVFVPDGAGIRTEAFDPSLMQDPSLIIYSPVRVLGGSTIFTNGDQTDTIYDSLAAGSTIEAALRTRCFEPDAPNYTPRISAVCTLDGNGSFSLNMSILKAASADGSACARYFWEYEKVPAGTGYFIHTYMGDGAPIPSFEGEPEQVELPSGDAREVAEAIWNGLDADNKVSLWVETIDLASGKRDTVIINKNVK